MLDRITKDRYLAQIISGEIIGKYKGTEIVLRAATHRLRLRSFLIYDKAIEECRYENMLTREQAARLVIFHNIFPNGGDKEIASLEAQSDTLKLDMYDNHLSNPAKTAAIRKSLRAAQTRIEILSSAKQSFDHLTIEGYAQLCQFSFIIENSLYDLAGKKIIEIDGQLLEFAQTLLLKNRIDVHTLRELARSEPWKSYNVGEIDHLFGRPKVDLTDEQRNLLMYTEFYNNVYKHESCPSQMVINDDDLLDGWLISVKRENEAERKNKKDNLPDADDVFIVAQSEEHRKHIDGLNDGEARKIKQNRQELIEKKGKVKEADLPDVKKELQKQVNEVIRGRK